jgi:hypothetical protein
MSNNFFAKNLNIVNEYIYGLFYHSVMFSIELARIVIVIACFNYGGVTAGLISIYLLFAKIW